MIMSIEWNWTFAQYKDYLTRVNFYQRLSLKKKIIKKSNIFVKQYVKTKLKTTYKNRGKYIIISRSDLKEYRRW